MKPKPHCVEADDLFRSRLDQIICMDHALVKLSKGIDWESLEHKFGTQFNSKQGAPAISTRLMVGLHYLKYTFNQSDEGVVACFTENPYWQYFCGFEYFTHEPPIHPTSMTKWRKRVGEAGAEALLQETIKAAMRNKLLRADDVKKVNVDTTVQEKNATFPTDPKLYYAALKALVRQAKTEGLKLRQSYVFVSKDALRDHNRFRHTRKYKEANKRKRKLRTYLGRVIRDIRGKQANPSLLMKDLLERAERVHKQQQKDKNKIYSVHEPHMECIGKGKAHKKYEFGCKASFVTTSRSNFIVGAQALHGNPYDGHTLKQAIEQTESLTNISCHLVYCDRGYKGVRKKDLPNCEVYLAGNRYQGLSRTEKHWLRRRAAIEPIIGHMKSDHRLNRNFLKGIEGDKLNAIFSAAGFNFKKLLNFFFPIFSALQERSQRLSDTFYEAFSRFFAKKKFTTWGFESR